MIKILGIDYMTSKECADRYGHSESCFEKRRMEKKPPSFIKLQGKILYEVGETDEWIKNNMKKMEY